MPLPTIACKECGHTNEGERLYCHECGAKLDRSGILIQQKEKEKKTGGAEEAQKRVQRILKPESRFMHGFFKTAVRTLLLEALTALLADVLLPPRGLPEQKDAQVYSDAPRAALEAFRFARAGYRRTVTEDEINSYLKGAVQLRTTGPLKDWLTFERVFTQLGDGNVVQVNLQKALKGFPLYAGVKYRVALENRAVKATPLGMNLGRLNLPAAVVAYSGVLFDPVWKALRNDQELLSQVGSIDIREKEVILSAAGSPALPPAGSPAAPAEAGEAAPPAPSTAPSPAEP